MRFPSLVFVATILFLVGFSACQLVRSGSPEFPDDPPPPQQADLRDSQGSSFAGKAFSYGEDQARFAEWGYGLPYDVPGLYATNLVMQSSQLFFLRATDLQLDPHVVVKACAPGGLVHRTGWLYHNDTQLWEQFLFTPNRYQAGVIKKRAQNGAVVDSAWIENCAQAELSFPSRSFLSLGDDVGDDAVLPNYVLAYVCFPTGDPYKPWKCGCSQPGEEVCRKWTIQSFRACDANHARIDEMCTNVTECALGALHKTIQKTSEGTPPFTFSLRGVPHQFSIQDISIPEGTTVPVATVVVDFERTTPFHINESFTFLDGHVMTLLDIVPANDGSPGSIEFLYNNAPFAGTIERLRSCVPIIDKIGFCGDGALGPLEECDDSNQVGGDGCSASCLIEEPAKVCITDFAGVPDQRTVCTPKTGVPGVDDVLSVCSSDEDASIASITVVEQTCLAIDDTECAARNTIVCPTGQRCREGACGTG